MAQGAHPERCDLSPDGQHFIYFALDGRWGSESRGSYTAVSQPPYLKALSFYPRGDTWGGGGLFIDNYRFYTDIQVYPDVYRDDGNLRETKRLIRVDEPPPAPYQSTFLARMIRDGWTFIGTGQSRWVWVLERSLNHDWMLRCTHEGSRDRYELFRGDETLPQPDWSWADLDGFRLVYTARGCLWTAPVVRSGLGEPQLLHDFNGMSFEPIAAPY